MNHRQKFQELLRRLFQFESADLDFGIYRIMNFKRDVIEKFIEKDFLDAVEKELKRGALAEQSETAKQLEEKKQAVKEALGDEALDAEDNLKKDYKSTKIGKEYLKLKDEVGAWKSQPALEATIFNHLYTFFSRYYDAGDFISKRRYSKREKYAIPYNGEDVYLHWANSDQYYIKTTENFTNYSFKSGNVSIHFKIQQADVEKDNVKGDKRFFIPLSKQVAFNSENREIVIPFQYRPLTQQEEITHGKKNQQDSIIAQALKDIPEYLKKEKMALQALIAERRQTSDGQPVSFLEHHLRRYTRRNTSDYFIHKDLKSFLERELDFYVKNEVLNLDELETGGEARAEAWFQTMRVIKAIGRKIIEFLAQIENFQKKLFEKRKFITETNYCITLGSIPEEFYEEIASCEPQWREWQQLFDIKEEERDLFTSGMSKKEWRVAFLKAHPTLVLDTKHFVSNFLDRLLSGFEDLEELTDGLLIHSENCQALGLIRDRYRHQIKYVYLDPPYNTGGDGFQYKDAYRHSSWMSMFYNRLAVAKPLLDPQGILYVHIDNNEQPRLRFVGEYVLGEHSFHTMIAWKNKYGPGAATLGIGDLHEYILVFSIDPGLTLTAPLDDETVAQYCGRDEKYAVRGGFVTQPLATRSKDPRPNLVYPIAYKGQEIWPDKQWIWSRERMEAAIANNEVVFNRQPDGSFSVRFKQYLRDEQGRIRRRKPLSLLLGPFNQDGTRDIENLFGQRIFTFPKPAALAQRLLAIQADEWQLVPVVLDYMAGSGTTGHAAINLSREDGTKHKFILIEMGEYFDTVLLPRIKKVTFTPEWKDGKPKRQATPGEAERSPRIVKYMRLESYEDALNNIAFQSPTSQKLLEFDDYLLKYLLHWETKESETLLNVERLSTPFSYKLKITEDQETSEKTVDLPETFNYLLGLHHKTRRVYYDDERRYLVYRGTIDHRDVAVIWRETEGWKKSDYERDRAFVEKQKLTDGADEIFVNCDSSIPDAKPLDSLFKQRMFAEV